MALLGLLSLSCMVLKNGIVLLDQINTEMHSGKEPYQAVFDSGVSRVRPVAMAAITTILTLVIVPVLYTMFYRIPYRPLAEL
jgi:multidrug efflux pump subunit AcrB